MTEGGDLDKLGRGTVWRNELQGCLHQNHVFALRPSVHRLDARYLALVTQSRYARYYFESTGTKTTNLASTNRSKILDFPVPLPPLEEQRRIADFLDGEIVRMDKLSGLRNRQVALLVERMRSIWSETFYDLGEKFGWAPLRRFILSITDGPFGSSLTSAHYVDQGARVVRLGNIGSVDFRDKDKAFISAEYFSALQRHEVRAGDLIIAGLGDDNHPLGRACIAPEGLGKAIVKADCFRARLDQQVLDHEYVAWALSSPIVNEQATLGGRGSTRARINLEVAKDLRIPVASMAAQQGVIRDLAAIRQDVRAAVRACEAQLALLAERREALVTAAVTGAVDVTTARG